MLHGLQSGAKESCFDFSGIQQQTLTPGEVFDVEYRSDTDTSPYKALRFFDATDGITACGDTRLKLSNGVQRPFESNGTVPEEPVVVAADGTTTVLAWNRFTVKPWQTKPLLVCLCDHDYFLASNSNDSPCSNPGNYTINAGYIQVRG